MRGRRPWKKEPARGRGAGCRSRGPRPRRRALRPGGGGGRWRRAGWLFCLGERRSRERERKREEKRGGVEKGKRKRGRRSRRKLRAVERACRFFPVFAARRSSNAFLSCAPPAEDGFASLLSFPLREHVVIKALRVRKERNKALHGANCGLTMAFWFLFSFTYFRTRIEACGAFQSPVLSIVGGSRDLGSGSRVLGVGERGLGEEERASVR